MTTTLPPELESFVERKVASGTFRDRDEVVCEALRLMAKDEGHDERLDHAVAESRRDMERGDYVDCDIEDAGRLLEEVFEEACS